MMAGTEIMTIADLNTMEARVDVGEVDVVLVAPGQKVHLEVDSFKDQKFNGVVTDVANSANNNDTSSAALFRFDLDGRDEIPGQDSRDGEGGLSAGNVGRRPNIETRSRTNALSVPIQSVTTRLPLAAAGQTNPPPVAGRTNPPPAGAVSTNDYKSAGKTNEPPKMIEVVFLVEGDHAKSAPVKRGISDDNYTEITEGLHEGDTVVSGGYKAINRDLEDGKKVVVGAAAGGGQTQGGRQLTCRPATKDSGCELDPTRTHHPPLPNGRGNHPCLARCFPGGAARRICRDHGAVRLGQINPDEPAGLPGHGDLGSL